MKDVAYIIHLLDEYKSKEIHWIVLHVNGIRVTYFDSFVVEHILQEITKFIDNKNIITSIFSTQAYDSIMCRYFSIEFIDTKFKDERLKSFTNLFSPNNLGKNDKVIIFLNKIQVWVKHICVASN